MKWFIPWLLAVLPFTAQPWSQRLKIVDAANRPIAGAEVVLDATRSRVVIRKPGYQSKILKISDAPVGGRVVLNPQTTTTVCSMEPNHPDWPANLRHTQAPGEPHAPLPPSEQYAERYMVLNGKPALDIRTNTAGRHSRSILAADEAILYTDVDAATARQYDYRIARACQFELQVLEVTAHGQPIDHVQTQHRSPRVIFRHSGYQTVVTEPAIGLRIAMEPAADAPFARCPDKSTTGTIPWFHFPVDVKEHGIRHGWGINWSLGLPPTRYIRESVEYTERAYGPAFLDIIDARGILLDGTYWRHLGHLGETADYETKDPETAKKLDAILDALCLTRPAPLPPEN